MGHAERQRIIETRNFVSHLTKLDIPSGCLHSAIVAMGGQNMHLIDVVFAHESRVGVRNLDAFLHKQGLLLSGSVKIDRPLSLSQTKKLLESPKEIVAGINNHMLFRVAGVLFSFGEYENEPPHVVGVLPRGDMTKNLRTILKENRSHVVVDTSRAHDPVYQMTLKNIAENLNAFVLNKIDVSFHVIGRLKS